MQTQHLLVRCCGAEELRADSQTENQQQQRNIKLRELSRTLLR